MAHETTIRKNAHGQWTATTIIMLSDTHQFSLTTSKRGDGYVTSSASVGHVSADGRSTIHMMFEDYSKTLHSQKYPRVTSKVIESQHAEVLVDIDGWVNEARAKYHLELQYA